ncbi:hypothetical protein Cci01nite_44400 [Catellatospora citrea]|uniref:Uncharacterized protein n=1 Tax=Catellatospora citrea TaxID=53366 RepID=A0A8J3KFY0_9ACTN|nr:hypothetical protein Cci01nite_44400 [Catellatospora citrea]
MGTFLVLGQCLALVLLGQIGGDMGEDALPESTQDGRLELGREPDQGGLGLGRGLQSCQGGKFGERLGDDGGLLGVDGSGGEGFGGGGKAVQRPGELDGLLGGAYADAPVLAQPDRCAGRAVGGRDGTGVELADEGQLHAGQAFPQAVRGIECSDQLSVGQRPHGCVGAGGDCPLCLRQCFPHGSTLELTYDIPR